MASPQIDNNSKTNLLKPLSIRAVDARAHQKWNPSMAMQADKTTSTIDRGRGGETHMDQLDTYMCQLGTYDVT